MPTESLYVNSADVGGWTGTGSTPYLNAQDYPTNIISTSTKKAATGQFGFANHANTTDTVNSVILYAYGYEQTDLDVTSTLYNGAGGSTTINLPQVRGWVNTTVTTTLDTMTKVNAAYITFVHGNITRSADVDCAYLYVDYNVPATTYTKNTAVDTLFRKQGISKNTNIDTLFKKEGIIKNVGIDVRFAKNFIKNTVFDILFRKQDITKNTSIDMLLRKLGIEKNTPIDVAFKKLGIEKNTNIDIWFSKGYTEYTLVDVLFRRQNIERTVLVDIILKAIYEKYTSIDVDFKKEGIELYTNIDTIFSKAGTKEKFTNIDVMLKALDITLNTSIDVLFRYLGIELFTNVDVIFIKRGILSTQIDTLLKKEGIEKSVKIDVYFGTIIPPEGGKAGNVYKLKKVTDNRIFWLLLREYLKEKLYGQTSEEDDKSAEI